MRFSEHLWQSIVPVYQRIIRLPFNAELAEGTLDEKRFIFYITQDSHYLIHFSRALALIAGRSVSSKTISQFLNFSLGALCAERELHATFLPSNYSSDEIDPSPSCLAYTQYLIAIAATASLEEAIAAVLPCFWIYREVGCNMAANCVCNNPYAKWIETYSSKEFSYSTNKAIDLLDKIAEECPTEVLERMKKAFEYSTLFEWHFWDDAYKMNIFKDSIHEVHELIKA
jgi:thiaminase/transcriptional activator TenA